MLIEKIDGPGASRECLADYYPVPWSGTAARSQIRISASSTSMDFYGVVDPVLMPPPMFAARAFSTMN